MDLRKLKKLIDLVEESGIAELEITEGEERFASAATCRRILRRHVAADANLFFAFGDFELRNARFFHQIDQLFEFA